MKKGPERRFLTSLAFRLAQLGLKGRLSIYAHLLKDTLEKSETRIVDDPYPTPDLDLDLDAIKDDLGDKINYRVQALREICTLILGSMEGPFRIEEPGESDPVELAKLDIHGELEYEIGRLVDTPDIQKVKRK